MKRLLLAPLLIALTGCSNDITTKTDLGEKYIVKESAVTLDVDEIKSSNDWIYYSGKVEDESSGGFAFFRNGDLATATILKNESGKTSIIVERIDKSGSLLWSQDVYAEHHPNVGSVLVNSKDVVYIVGATKKVEGGESGLNDSDIFAASLSGTGENLWYENYGVGIHEVGSKAVLDGEGNLLLSGRISEVSDNYSFIKDVNNFYGAEFSGGWRGFQLKINSQDGRVKKAYTTGSYNSGGELIAIDQSRNIAFIGGYTFGAVNGVPTIGNGDPAGANKYLIARNETTEEILWTRMENWIRSNIVIDELDDSIYFIDKGILEKIKGTTGKTIWTRQLEENTGYLITKAPNDGILLTQGVISNQLLIRNFDSNGDEIKDQLIKNIGDGNFSVRMISEQGNGNLIISGTTTSNIILENNNLYDSNQKGKNSDSFILKIESKFSDQKDEIVPTITGNPGEAGRTPSGNPGNIGEFQDYE